jgi:tRNA uridine 5-carboxymethylaminomethyl modification enzyme
MFTSRAEYRLQLREDNADLRLSARGRELGLVDDARWEAFERKRDGVAREQARLAALWAGPGNALGAALRESAAIEVSRETHGLDLLRRPGLDYARLTAVPGFGPPVADPAVAAQVEVQARYAGYLDRQHDEIARNRRLEGLGIPGDFDYERVRGLSAEVLQKLRRAQPATVGQATRIPGVTPAAISLLLVHLRRSRVA